VRVGRDKTEIATGATQGQNFFGDLALLFDEQTIDYLCIRVHNRDIPVKFFSQIDNSGLSIEERALR